MRNHAEDQMPIEVPVEIHCLQNDEEDMSETDMEMNSDVPKAAIHQFTEQARKMSQ